MKLIGFGCSFTYGSELINPELEKYNYSFWDRHHENTPYRQRHVWLGQLADQLGYEYVNYAEPSCSNYAISQIFYDFMYGYLKDTSDPIIVCVGWTHADRMSWWDKGWVHDGFIRYNSESRFKNSFKDWLAYPERNKRTTDHAKMFVNSVCALNNIPIIQFDAIRNINARDYPNFFMKGTAMDLCLEREGERLGRNFLASGGHPNELGHAYYVKLLLEWAKAKKIVQ